MNLHVFPSLSILGSDHRCSKQPVVFLDLCIGFCLLPESFLEFPFLQHRSVSTLSAFTFSFGIVTDLQDTGNYGKQELPQAFARVPNEALRIKFTYSSLHTALYGFPSLLPTPLHSPPNFGSLGLR